jgi:hypothetical protein
MTLAKQMGCSDRSIRNWQEELETNSLLQIERRNGQTNLYHPLIPDSIEGRNPGSALNSGAGEGGTPVPTNINNEQEEGGPPLEGGPAPLAGDGEPDILGFPTDRRATEEEAQQITAGLPWRKT